MGKTISVSDKVHGTLQKLCPKSLTFSEFIAQLIKEYEKLRLELIGETERVLLEGFCNQCQKSSAFSMNIIEYTKRLANAHFVRLSITCPKCYDSQRTLRLPNLWW